MAFCGYKYKYNLNMLYNSDAENPEAKLAHLTFEITLYIQKQRMDESTSGLYQELERKAEQYLSEYEGAFIEKIELFKKVPFTIERIGEMFYTALREKLNDENYSLARMEISETPEKIYVISDFLKQGLLESEAENSDKRLEHFIRKSLPYVQKRQKEAALEEEWEQPLVSLEKEAEWIEAENSLKEEEEGGQEEKEKEEEEEQEQRELDPMVKRHIWMNWIRFLAAAFFFLALSAIGCIYLLKRDDFPFGQEVYLFLGKAEYLYRQIKAGQILPMFMDTWFNGCQLFITTPPLSYYIMAFIRAFSGNAVTAYSIYIGVVFFACAMGWLTLGRYSKNLLNGILAGILWILMPGVLGRFAFYGNPAFLLSMTWLPYQLLAVEKSRRLGRKRDYFLLGALFFLAALTESFYTFFLLAGLVVYRFVYGFRKGKRASVFQMMFICLLGILLTWPWLFVAMRYGAFDSTGGLEEGFSINIGLGLAAVFGIIIGKKRSRSAFCLAFAFWLLPVLGKLPIAENIPFAKYIFYSGYVILSVGFLLLAFIKLKKSRLTVSLCLFCILLAGGIWEARDFIFQRKEGSSYEGQYQNIAENGLLEAVKMTDSQLLYLEVESDNAFLPYYASVQGKRISSTYRLKEQNPQTALNLLRMEAALREGYYTYVFDRALEGGNDTIVLGKKELRLDEKEQKQRLLDNAANLGYKFVEENEEFLFFHRDGMAGCGIVTEYKGIAIGSSADKLAMLYPALEEGVSDNVEDYSLKELKKYKKVLLAGFSYNTKEEAEKMVAGLVSNGVQVYIDVSQPPFHGSNQKQEFLDVSKKVVAFQEPYSSLADVLLQEEDGVLPVRKLVPIDISFNGRHILVKSEQDGVNTTWAYQDIFTSEQEVKNKNHYLIVDAGETALWFSYGKVWYGAGIAGILIVLFAAWQFKIEVETENKKYEKKSQ